MEEWFRISDVGMLDTPALLVYPDRVKQNLAQLTASIEDVSRLRPHVKTHKNQEAVQLTMAAGIGKFKCATIAEAEMLALCHAPDVLLAYQPIGPKAERFVQLIKHYPETRFSCLIDTYTAAQQLNALAAAGALTIPVFLDFNVGMNRSGIAPAAAVALYEQCQQLPNVEIVGLHAYDGHIRDEDFTVRTERCHQAFAQVEAVATQLRAVGLDPIVVAGGSPTFPIHATRKGVECSPGTFIYWDGGYGKTCVEQPFSPAALVLSRVISLPDATKLCVDLGHKSIAAESSLDKRVTFLNAPELAPISQSEEHLVLEAGPSHGYQVGDVLYGLPYHICPTVALYERAVTIQDREVVGEWKTIARDRKITF
ncbi:D-TA family PLP-dependent enzyme [Hymenobacter volaticus]|uniref:D-TA family PLP-dependent enzyme n=1 Tax=Hymenobacter volaticus TaxID=2932254 RepID=A0ABY4GDB9_9BACT|nr:D-TA family PLP-dependent enzyme [Hymenobacter volaticus]UOQ68879.1 D-TA family PLP-dependent enzyme [Hymenobacter volaticus]